MSEVLRKTPSLETVSSQTSSAVHITPCPTPLTAAESSSEKTPDLPPTSHQRNMCDSPMAPFFKFGSESPTLSSWTPVAPTWESLANTLAINKEEKAWRPEKSRFLDICKRDSRPSPLSDSSGPCQERPRKKTKLFDSLKSYSPRVRVENRGSVARDHLASERTFLAYVRTSLALTSMGVAFVQLFSISEATSGQTSAVSGTTSTVKRFAKPFGITSIMFALLLLSIGIYRYFLVQNNLPGNKFPVARFSLAFITFLLTSLIVVIFGALLGGKSAT